ncbi:MAG: hypothetical protein NT061_13565 [Spirochaetes bacterium]|nr:hypothetical protein [Spirochaetota bacterium]
MGMISSRITVVKSLTDATAPSGDAASAPSGSLARGAGLRSCCVVVPPKAGP